MPPHALVPNPLKADGQPVIFGGGGGSGAVQIQSYINDPNIEGVTPADITIPNMAYRKTGDGPTFVWNTDTYLWV